MKIRFRHDEDGSSDFHGRVASVHDSAQPAPPPARTAWRERLPVETGHRPPAVDLRTNPLASAQCSALQAHLFLRSHEGRTNVTLFVGASPRCGTSTVAAGLVESLSRVPGSRVLLVDFARRRSGAPADPALSDLLYWLDAQVRTRASAPGETLQALSRISFGSMASSLFQAGAFDEFLHAARERFDHVVIDAPALQSHPETLVLGRKADSVVLVIESGRTRKQTALWAQGQLARARANVVGVVLNRRRFYVPRWLYERF